MKKNQLESSASSFNHLKDQQSFSWIVSHLFCVQTARHRDRCGWVQVEVFVGTHFLKDFMCSESF